MQYQIKVHPTIAANIEALTPYYGARESRALAANTYTPGEHVHATTLETSTRFATWLLYIAKNADIITPAAFRESAKALPNNAWGKRVASAARDQIISALRGKASHKDEAPPG